MTALPQQFSDDHVFLHRPYARRGGHPRHRGARTARHRKTLLKRPGTY